MTKLASFHGRHAEIPQPTGCRAPADDERRGRSCVSVAIRITVTIGITRVAVTIGAKWVVIIVPAGIVPSQAQAQSGKAGPPASPAPAPVAPPQCVAPTPIAALPSPIAGAPTAATPSPIAG